MCFQLKIISQFAFKRMTVPSFPILPSSPHLLYPCSILHYTFPSPHLPGPLPLSPRFPLHPVTSHVLLSLHANPFPSSSTCPFPPSILSNVPSPCPYPFLSFLSCQSTPSLLCMPPNLEVNHNVNANSSEREMRIAV